MSMTPARLKDIENDTNEAWKELMLELGDMSNKKQKAIQKKVMRYAVRYHHLSDALFKTLS